MALPRVMESSIASAFVNLGAVGLMLWWLTLKLVPQLQRERNEAITAFREEMCLERDAHQRSIQQIIEHCQTEIRMIVEAKETP